MVNMYVNVIKQSLFIISAFGPAALQFSLLVWSSWSDCCHLWTGQSQLPYCALDEFSALILYSASVLQQDECSIGHIRPSCPELSVSFICTLYLCLSCQPVLDLLVTLFLSPTWAFCPRFGCSGWVLLKPAEQRGSKLLQHLFLCYACGATVGFLSNSFKQ